MITTHRILNVALAIAVTAAWLYLAANFDREAEQGDTRHQAGLASELRFAKAAASVCGANAAWELLGDGAVQCRTKRGHKTIVAQVQP